MTKRRGPIAVLLTCAAVAFACELPAPADPAPDAGDIDGDPIRADAEADSTTDVEDEANADTRPADAGADGALLGLPLNARFDLNASDFTGTPWPSDHRLLEDGTPDLSTFPGANEGIMRTFRGAIEGVIDGYSTMPVVFVSFEDDLAGLSLPSAETTLRSGSTVQLIDVSEEGCGTRTPLVVNVDLEGDGYRPANTLMASPVPGFVLRQRTPYAFVLRREFGLDRGREVVTPPALLDALAGGGDAGLASSLAPFVRCLAGDDLSIADIGVVTVFTTQDASSELRLVRDHVVDPALTPSPVVSDLEVDERETTEGRTVWSGTYETPIYQEGVSPYATQGSFVFRDGAPVPQRQEVVPFAIAVPDGDGPFPVLVFVGGTGASVGGTFTRQPTADMLAEGFAIATFAPQFHDARAVPGSEPITHSFNYLNPNSGRTVFRQQAVDTAYFVRVLREALGEAEFASRIDPSLLVYGGHSQGGLVGALLAGVESEFLAYVLNGTGSYISVTITLRTDPIDIPGLIEEIFAVGRPIDVQHPLAALVQLGTDVVEPHNLAPFWKGHASDPDGAHVLVINGINDTTTFVPSMNAMAISADLAPVAPAGWDFDPFQVWERRAEPPPIRGNREALDGSPLTFATFMDGDGDHFVLRRNAEIRASAVRFWRGAIDGVPSVE